VKTLFTGHIASYFNFKYNFVRQQDDLRNGCCTEKCSMLGTDLTNFLKQMHACLFNQVDCFYSFWYFCA